MIANALFTFALLLALVFWLMGELKFFIPYKLVLWHEYATPSLTTSLSCRSPSLLPPSFSSANSSQRITGENSPISTNSFTPAGPSCPRPGLKRSPTEMARGYEPEEFIGSREVFEERQHNAQQPYRKDTSPNHVREERAQGAGSHTDPGAG